jgi:hypothetical protein
VAVTNGGGESGFVPLVFLELAAHAAIGRRAHAAAPNTVDGVLGQHVRLGGAARPVEAGAASTGPKTTGVASPPAARAQVDATGAPSARHPAPRGKGVFSLLAGRDREANYSDS